MILFKNAYAGVLLATLITTAGIAFANPVEKYAMSVQIGVSKLRACALSQGTANLELARLLNETYFELLLESDVQLVDPSLHFRKIDAYYAIDQHSKNSETDCRNQQKISHRTLREMEADLIMVRKGQRHR